MNRSIVVALVVAAVSLVGCKDETQSTGPAPAAPAGGAPAAQGGGQSHANLELGETTAGGLTLKARQESLVKPGGDAGFDLHVTGPKPKSVRFWVGVESAQGSAKTRADEESADTWHAHPEVPSPLPPGSKFWAEIEPQSGAAFSVSFELKQ